MQRSRWRYLQDAGLTPMLKQLDITTTHSEGPVTGDLADACLGIMVG